MRHRVAATIGAAIVGAALVAIGSPSVALAHVELASSTPADGATLTEAPGEVRLVFSGELNPDGSTLTVTDADGTVVGEGELDLAIADRNEVAGSVAINEGGTYTVTWSAASLDGHVEEGVLTFSVELADGGVQPPDTAAMDTGPTLPLAGLALLVIALGLAARAWSAGGHHD